MVSIGEHIIQLRKAKNWSQDELAKEMVKRLDEPESLPVDEKQRILHYMDLIISDYKTKRTYNLK